jgi:hypothetical protein
MKGTAEPQYTPAEMVRLFRLLLNHVEAPVFGEAGEEWIAFAYFLEEHGSRIQGKLRGTGERSVLDSRLLKRIIEEHGRFVATGDASSLPRRFEYDSGWAWLSPADRRLLVDFAAAIEASDSPGKITLPRLSRGHKMIMALRLSWKSWPAEIVEHAKAAFTDWTFVATFVVISAVYVGLWLTPDPSMITKVAALTLTAVLLYNFAVEDVIGLIEALSQLARDCEKAVTVQGLQRAGARFAKKVGQVGFDIILFLVTWRIGKRVAPKLREYGAKRSVQRAEAMVAEAKRQPGAEPSRPDTGGSNKVLDAAKRTAGKNSGPREILDALAERLPNDARQGLDLLRGSTKGGDARVLQILEGQAKGGLDIVYSLQIKAMPEAQVRAAGDAVSQGEMRLARAKAVEQDVLSGKEVRSGVRREQILRLLERMERVGILRELATRIKKRYGLDKPPPDAVKAILAESISVVELQARYPRSKGYEVLSNMEIVRRVSGYKTIAQWKQANPEGSIGKLREADGKLWESVTELDSVVVQRGVSGKLRLIEVEQVKTGAETHGAAQAQNAKALKALRQLQKGDASIGVFLRAARTKLGKNLTSQVDVSGLSEKSFFTRGPAEKNFDRGLYEMTNKVLDALALDLVERGLPPKEPTKVKPLTSRESEDE